MALALLLVAGPAAAATDEPSAPPATSTDEPSAAAPGGAREAPTTAASSDAPSTANAGADERIEALERALREGRAEDRARIEALERELAAQREARAAREAPPSTGDHPRPKRPVDVEVTGLLQVDAIVYRQTSRDEVIASTGEPQNDERVLLRRARPRFVAHGGPFSAAIMLDGSTVNGPALRVLEAEVTAAYRNPRNPDVPWLAVGVGSFRSPFGFELQQPARQRFFLERTTAARALFGASFDLGLRVYGGLGALRYSLAAMNGEPAGSAPFPQRDPNAAKDLIARLGVDTEVAPHVRVAGGFSMSTGRGFSRGARETKDRITWRDDNENGVVEITEIRVIPGSPATPSSSYGRFVIGADARVTVDIRPLGPLLLEAEIYRGSNMDRALVPSDPVTSGRDLRQLGYYLAASQHLGDHAVVGARFDAYNPDADASEQRGLSVVPSEPQYSTWTIAAAAILTPARLVAQYERRRNPLGRAPSGAPATLADDMFTVRAEVAF